MSVLVGLCCHPRKADKADKTGALPPHGNPNGSLLVASGTKRETYFSDWVIRGSGKLHCVRFITLRRVHRSLVQYKQVSFAI